MAKTGFSFSDPNKPDSYAPDEFGDDLTFNKPILPDFDYKPPPVPGDTHKPTGSEFDDVASSGIVEDPSDTEGDVDIYEQDPDYGSGDDIPTYPVETDDFMNIDAGIPQENAGGGIPWKIIALGGLALVVLKVMK